MSTETILTITTITLPIITGGLGYILKSTIEKKRELLSEVNIERRAAYQIFVNMVIDIFADIKTNKGNDVNNSLKQLREFYKKNVLFASPSVVISFSNYMQYIYTQDDNKKESKDHALVQLKMLTVVMKDMRKDLGLSNKGLGDQGEILIRALITDFDSLNIENFTIREPK